MLHHQWKPRNKKWPRVLQQGMLGEVQRRVILSRLADAGVKSFTKIRASGKDPSHRGEAARKRGRSNARRAREREDWKRLNSEVDVEVERQNFVDDLLPKIRDIPVRRIVNVTGLSIRYASMIRRAFYTPHPMHYEKIETLISL